MIKEKFSIPAQGVRVQKTTQIKNGITLILESNTATVEVEDSTTKNNAKKALDYFFNAAINCTDIESLNAYYLHALSIANIKIRNTNDFRKGVEL